MRDLKTEALQQEWQFRDATQQELLKFKNKLSEILKNPLFDKPENLKNRILNKLRIDKELIQQLNNSLKDYAPGREATWSLKTNKMLEILDGTIAFIDLQFDKFIKSIEDNDELANYHIKTNEEDVTIIANTGVSIYGTSKASFFKTALINTYLVYLGKHYLSDIDINAKGHWIDQTPNAHVTPLPDNLNPENIKVGDINFKKCTYFYSDDKTSKGLAFVHSGYAFGGYRNESRYPYQPSTLLGKLNGPEDCSSFIGKLTLEVDQISTADLWNRWKYQREGYPNEPAWEKSPTGKLLIENYIPVEPSNIQSADIWATRSFDTTTDPEMKGVGKGGHTALIIDKAVDEKNNNVKTLGYNRNMPRNEGFGIQAFPIYPDTPNKRILFFRLKPQPQESHKQESIPSLCCCNII